MSAPPPNSNPPTYNESVHGYPPPEEVHPQAYGTVNPPPAGAYTQQPPVGMGAYPPAYDGSKQGGYYPPQAGYPHPGMPPQAGPVPSYQTTSNQNVVIHPTQSVVVVGGCPSCRVGVLEDDFTCLGVMCAICFFPIGLLCCLAMRQRRCAHCGAVYG